MNTKPLTHHEESLDRDINLIRQKVLEMANLVERALTDALQAVLQRHRRYAYAVILRDPWIDDLEKQIDRLCLEFLVRQQPVARHLRLAYATIKINAEIERIGDYAESIVRQVLKLEGVDYKFPPERFQAIADLSIPMFHDSVQAFVNQDCEQAQKIMAVEEQVDNLRKQLDAELVQARQAGLIPLEALVPLLTIVRRFERVSDQSKNLCEEVIYLCTGQYAKHKGTEAIRVLFVDQHNSCRSQMAEAVALGLKLPSFIFSSAGLSPQPLDPHTIEFLKSRGTDISRHVPRALSQVPNLEHYQVVIALDKAAKAAFPSLPNKTVCLDWDVRDPSALHASPEEMQKAYEETYGFIENHLKDLAEAILGNTKT